MENTSDQSTIFGSDRGWNDPPPRLDTTASAATGSSGARLNKRVGFPSSFTSQSSDVKTDQMPLCDAGAKSLTGIFENYLPKSFLEISIGQCLEISRFYSLEIELS